MGRPGVYKESTADLELYTQRWFQTSGTTTYNGDFIRQIFKLV